MRILLGALAMAVALWGQDHTIVLRAARLFDGKSGRVISPGVVVVAGGKIQSVGSTAATPAGAEVIDLGAATILPGFIDAHTHLSHPYSTDFRQRIIEGEQETIAEQALDATEDLRKTLLAGFTTCRDVGSSDFIDVGLRNAIARLRRWSSRRGPRGGRSERRFTRRSRWGCGSDLEPTLASILTG